jgi:hypothetical protein
MLEVTKYNEFLDEMDSICERLNIDKKELIDLFCIMNKYVMRLEFEIDKLEQKNIKAYKKYNTGEYVYHE